MGMCLALCAVTPRTLAAVLADPPLVWKVIAPGEPDMYARARQEQRGLFARLLGRSAPAHEAEIDVPAEEESTDIDKAWHGIHYLLTGTADENDDVTGYLISGGTQVGTLEVGYGPARAFDAGEVALWSRTLNATSVDELRRRFRPAEMMELEIYPEIWDRAPADDDSLEYCIAHFETLRAFVASAAERGRGILVYLT